MKEVRAASGTRHNISAEAQTDLKGNTYIEGTDLICDGVYLILSAYDGIKNFKKDRLHLSAE